MDKNKKEVSKGKKAKGGKVKNADDSSNITTSTSSIIAPPLVRLPVKKVKQIKPSSHVLQRSQPFNMNESTLTELANSEIVIELWTGEERNPGIEGTSDKLMGTGSMSRIMDKCMTQWPESFETIVELQGLGVGQTSPHVVIKIIHPNNSVQQGLTLITIQLAKKSKQPSWTRWSTTISSESGLTNTAIDNETKTTDTHVNDRRGPPINILDALKQAETEKEDEDDEQDGDEDNTEDDMFTKYPKRYEMAKTICKFLKLSCLQLKNNNLLLKTRIILTFFFILSFYSYSIL